MRIDVFLQYYKPHMSGLTNMAADIAEHLAGKSFEVHVHSIAEASKPYSKTINGVEAHYYPRNFSVGRASFSISLLWQIWKMRKWGGVAHLHLPYPESFLIANLFRDSWKIVTTYQCDAPKNGFIATVVGLLLDFSHRTLQKKSRFTVFSSEDYYLNSRAKAWVRPETVQIIPVTSRFRTGGFPKYRVPGKKTVGFIGRPTHEKGINELLNAISAVAKQGVVLLFAGPTRNLSEEAGFDMKLFKRLVEDGALRPLGYLPDHELKNFYASLDVFAFPSTNALEAFGIVQIEAMSAGVPVIASDLPGVRVLVDQTGFGSLVTPGDANALASAILKIRKEELDFEVAANVLEARYAYPRPVVSYERLFTELMRSD